MRYLLRLCLLLVFGVPLLVLFMIMIGTQGNDAADDMVAVLDSWLHS